MSGYKYVEFKCDGLRKGVVCHGPGGPSLLVTIYNCLVLRYGKVDEVPVVDYVTEETMLAGIRKTLLNNIMTYERSGKTMENYDDKRTMVLKMMDTLSVGFDVRPILHSNITFEETDGWWFFMFMGIPLLHGWVVDPKDKIIYDSVKMSSYDELVELLTKLESLKEESNSDVAAECAQIQGYLDAAKTPSTSYGFASLCSDLEEGEFAAFYWDGNFSVIHKKDGSLLTLETDGDFLALFPQAIWLVFDPNQQGDGNRIYLTTLYGPAKNQPNTTKAIAWYREKLANKGKKTVEASSSVEPANKSGETEKNVEPAEKNVDTDVSSGKLTRRQRRQNSRKNKNIAPANKGVEAQEDANEAATPSLEVQGEALNTATPSLGETEDHLRVPANSPCPTEEQKEGQANESVEKGGAQKVAAPSLVETKDDDNEESSVVVDDFLNFLCKFQDGRSKLKDGSRIPYFEGIVEAMKHTGSPIFSVPYDFIMKYNKGLAIAIQDQYPRINGALRQSVVQYLVQQGLDLLTACGTELEILHLPEPKTVQSFKSFADNNVMLEDYYVYRYWLEVSPSCVGRKMALGYLHRILNKFKTGRCWGGKWSESNMEVTDNGSNFVINCEDEELTPEAGLKDLENFDETVLRRFKGKKTENTLHSMKCFKLIA